MDTTNSHRSSQSTSTCAQAISHSRSTESLISPTRSKRNSEPGPSRNRRILDSRNAKFPAKKLSISGLSSRFSQLIHSSEEPQTTRSQEIEKENVPLRSRELQENVKSREYENSLGILNEIPFSSRNRKTRHSGNIAIYEDTPERPLLDRSPFSSPAGLPQVSPEDYSPIGFDHIQDNLGSMRLRDVSGNEYRRSPLASSTANSSLRFTKNRKSIQLRAGFDTQEYIEHLEKQLEDARNEMYSPTTNRSLQDQLKTARHDNDRLKKEVAEMRDMYEAEIKKAIERKAELEVNLRRKVKDLEDELEQKTAAVKDLELQHDERRLDSNTIDTFRATIEKLEHEKLSLEDENRSVSKRNEVLSELLAMSPTKLQSFELRSPVREKRAGRPMSMIIPKMPSSPRARQASQPTSAALSPATSACGSIFGPVKSRNGSPRSMHRGLGLSDVDGLDSVELGMGQLDRISGSHSSYRGSISRRSTLQSEGSLLDTTSAASVSSSPVEQTHHRQLPKRKPRKFMAGSTQLKPLLLPALTSDGMPFSATSTTTSPRIESPRHISQTSFGTTTHLLPQPSESAFEADENESTMSSLRAMSDQSGSDAQPVYKTFEQIVAEHNSLLMSETTEASDVSAHTRSKSSSTNEVDTGREHERHKGPGKSSSMDRSWAFARSEQYEPADYFGPFIPSATHNLPGQRQELPNFDLDSLNNLQLPDPQYDDLPNTYADVDETLTMDVPQPLFSVNKSIGDSREVIGNDAQFPELHNVRRQHSADFSNPCNMDVTNSEPHALPTPSSCLSSRVRTSSQEWRHSQSSTNVEQIHGNRSRTPRDSRSMRRESMVMTKSPIDILRSNKFGARPLASLTISTIFGTISKCTSSVRDFKRDPLALARRVIANAWFSNWARFGKLSWWVLGLFIRSGIGGPKLREWKWEAYDGEEIARRACEYDDQGKQSRSTSARNGITNTSHIDHRGAEHNDNVNSTSTSKVGWRQSVMLWGKFSVAIMLAVGGAVVKGPGEMLKEIGSDQTQAVEEHQRYDPDINHDLEYRDARCCLGHQYGSRKASQDLESGIHSRSFTSRSHVTSVSPSHYRQSSFTAYPPYSYHMPLASNEGPEHNDEEDTLRAIRSPRMHVAEVFHQRGASDIRHFRQPIAGSTSRRYHTQSVSDSNDGDMLQWPSSPGLIHSENNQSLR